MHLELRGLAHHYGLFPGQKQKYYVKAQKMAAFFDSVADVNRMIHFLRSLNPKLAYKMVDEL